MSEDPEAFIYVDADTPIAWCSDPNVECVRSKHLHVAGDSPADIVAWAEKVITIAKAHMPEAVR